MKAKEDTVKNEEIDDLEIFIKKKKVQTKVLKKIISKLNTEENHTKRK